MENKKEYQISKVKRKVAATGTIIEEESLVVHAPNKKDCEDMFDRRWNTEIELKGGMEKK